MQFNVEDTVMFHLGQIENTNIFKTNIVQMYTQFNITRKSALATIGHSRLVLTIEWPNVGSYGIPHLP